MNKYSDICLSDIMMIFFFLKHAVETLNRDYVHHFNLPGKFVQLIAYNKGDKHGWQTTLIRSFRVLVPGIRDFITGSYLKSFDICVHFFCKSIVEILVSQIIKDLNDSMEMIFIQEWMVRGVQQNDHVSPDRFISRDCVDFLLYEEKKAVKRDWFSGAGQLCNNI